MLAIIQQKIPAVNFAAGILIIYALIGLIFIPHYFTWDANAIMGIISIPYVCTIEKRRHSLRYLPPALCFIFLAILLPVNTLFFLATLFSILLLVENSYGRVNPVLFLMLILVSPVFKNITRMVEFPVRLWLSDQVAAFFNLAGKTAAAAGNLIILDKNEYAVDPACAGLNMLAASLLVCLVVIAFYQRKFTKNLPPVSVAIIIITTILLNVGCNFFRILLLVLFKVMPGNLFHDLIGTGCLLLYVIVPLLYGLKIAFKKFASPAAKPLANSGSAKLRYPLLHLSFLFMLILVSSKVKHADHLYKPVPNNIALNGYRRKNLDGGIIKLESTDALIYLKPTAFYAPEHDPMVCWTGSGYQFKNIRKEIIEGNSVYSALLTRDNDKIYASWWFDNGTTKTINQLDWRWRAARGGRPFYLVNVNSADSAQLKILATALHKQQHLLYP